MLDADYANDNSGYIKVNTAITTNGGNITMGGGSGTITAGSGYAWGNGGQAYGVSIGNSLTLNAGGGNIIMNGNGVANTVAAYGVDGASIVIETSGTGNISINGIGGSGTGTGDVGVLFSSTGGSVSTGTGNITITGTGGGSDAASYGVENGSGNNQFSTGGALNITGNASNGSQGIYFSNPNGNNVISDNGGNVTLSSNASINLGGGNTTGIVSSGGPMNVTIDADSGGAGGQVTVAFNITTNGGNITIGGGGNPLLDPAQGVSGTTSGVVINNGAVLNAGGTSSGGNISVLGAGYTGGANVTSAFGVSVGTGGIIETNNAGTVTVQGTGGGAGTGSGNYGVNVTGASSSIETTGSGNVSITGVRGSGSGGSNFGVNVAVADGIQTTGTGNITVNTDTIGLNQANDITSAGSLTIAPYTPAVTTMGVGVSSGTLDVTSTYLGYISAGTGYIFGATGDTGLLTAGGPTTWSKPVTFISGSGGITVSGAQTMGANNITLETNGTITLSSTITTTGNLTFMPATSHTVGVGAATCGSSCGVTFSDALIGSANLSYGSLTIGDTTNTSALDFSDSSRTFSKPLTLLSSGNVTLDSVVNDSYSGTALVIAAGGNFVNNVGSNPLNLTGTSPNWDIYSTGIQSDTNGAGTTGLSPTYTTYSATYAGEPPSGLAHPTSNNWLYSDANAGTITITATGQIVTYGTAPNTGAVLNTTYNCSGTCADISGAPTLSISGSVTTSTSGNYTYGTWTNDILTALGSLSFNSGYTGSFSLVNGTLTVNKKGLTITGFAANNKTYDGTTNATISSNGSLSGVVGGDSVSLNSGSASATFDNANVGTTHTVTASGYALSSGNGNNDAGNYTLTQPTASNVTISAAGLTITASNQTQTYGFGSLGTTGFSITSGQLFGSDAISGVTLATNDGTSTSGNYKYTASPGHPHALGGGLLLGLKRQLLHHLRQRRDRPYGQQRNAHHHRLRGGEQQDL